MSPASLLTPGSASPFSPRALRASAGSALRVPIAPRVARGRSDRVGAGAAAPRSRAPRPTAASRPRACGGQCARSFSSSAPRATGSLPELEAALDRRLTLPLGGGVESLNAAVAAGLLLFVLRPGLTGLPSRIGRPAGRHHRKRGHTHAAIPHRLRSHPVPGAPGRRRRTPSPRPRRLRAAKAVAGAPASEADRTLYALGLVISRNLAGFKLSAAELAIVEQGMADGVLGKPAEGRPRDVRAEAERSRQEPRSRPPRPPRRSPAPRSSRRKPPSPARRSSRPASSTRRRRPEPARRRRPPTRSRCTTRAR